MNSLALVSHPMPHPTRDAISTNRLWLRFLRVPPQDCMNYGTASSKELQCGKRISFNVYKSTCCSASLYLLLSFLTKADGSRPGDFLGKALAVG